MKGLYTGGLEELEAFKNRCIKLWGQGRLTKDQFEDLESKTDVLIDTAIEFADDLEVEDNG